MSYCRFGLKSDVYVYDDVSEMICCCGCRLLQSVPEAKEASVYLPTRSTAILHLLHHLKEGHRVPSDVVPRITKDLKKKGEGFEPFRRPPALVRFEKKNKKLRPR